MAIPPASKQRSRKASPPRVIVITSVYNATVTGELERDACNAFHASEITSALGLTLERYHVPGSFELVAAASMAAAQESVVAIVALGCIIKGETSHDEVLGHAVTQQLARISADASVPIGLGVLTVNTQAQALARAGLGKSSVGNKGSEAMQAALATLVMQLAIARGEGSDWMLDEVDAVASPDKLKAGKAKPKQAKPKQAKPKPGGAQ